eukprot:943229-Prymnesium_polylepis.1
MSSAQPSRSSTQVRQRPQPTTPFTRRPVSTPLCPGHTEQSVPWQTRCRSRIPTSSKAPAFEALFRTTEKVTPPP